MKRIIFVYDEEVDLENFLPFISSLLSIYSVDSVVIARTTSGSIGAKTEEVKKIYDENKIEKPTITNVLISAYGDHIARKDISQIFIEDLKDVTSLARKLRAI